jgi:hypothetical protein
MGMPAGGQSTLRVIAILLNAVLEHYGQESCLTPETGPTCAVTATLSEPLMTIYHLMSGLRKAEPSRIWCWERIKLTCN